MSPEDQTEYLGLLEEAYNHRLEDDLGFFIAESWHVVEPKTKFTPSWHYEYMCEWLMDVADGTFKQKYPDKEGIIFNVPPRTGKSTMVTVDFPVWTWLRFPERRFLCGSYSGKLAVDHHNKRRFLIGSEWFQKRWGHKFQVITNKADDFRNDKTGYFIATSVEGSGTGFGGDVCIGDDLLSAQDAFSKAMRTATNNWIDGTFSTRLNSRVTGAFVHVSQRLADDDPTGYLLEKYGDRYIHVKVPREEPEGKEFSFPRSGRIFYRPKGDVVQPERCPPLVLEGLKRKTREWANQEQQEPAPAGGAIVLSEWWRFYERDEPLPAMDIVVISVDCTFKAHTDSDYVAIQKWAGIGPRSYLLERQTEHLGYVGTKAAIRAMSMHGPECPWCRGLRPTAIIIEDAANGPAVIEELRRTSFGQWPDGSPIYIPIIAVQPAGGKEARLYAASAEFEAGNIYGCQEMPGWPQYFHTIGHYAGEGSVAHDDDVDATSQYINWRHKRKLGLTQFFESQNSRIIAAEALHRQDDAEVEITATNLDGKTIHFVNGAWHSVDRSRRWDGECWIDTSSGLPVGETGMWQ